MDSSAPPSVAQLAGRFREQGAAAKEVSQAVSQPLFGRGGEGAGGRGCLGQAQRRGRGRLGNYQIRKRSHRGVPLNVRNVATAGRTGPLPAEGGLHSVQEGETGRELAGLPPAVESGFLSILTGPWAGSEQRGSHSSPATSKEGREARCNRKERDPGTSGF